MATNQSSNLRPCPFCGNEKTETFYDFLSIPKANCPSCGAVVHVRYWNDRPLEDDLRDRLEEMEKPVQQIIVLGHQNW